MSPRKTTIRIRIHTLSRLGSVQDVAALLYGNVWAVHPDQFEKRNPGWVVTHVPTGRLARRDLTRRHAMTVARAVAEKYPGWGIRAKWNDPPRVPRALRQLVLES